MTRWNLIVIKNLAAAKAANDVYAVKYWMGMFE